MTTSPEENRESVSGLDMGPTIDFYRANQDALEGHIRDLFRDNAGHNTPETLPEMTGLDEDASNLVRGVLSLFPESARERSIARTVQGHPPLWFDRDSAAGSPRPTENPDEALSPTAIIPSYIGYARDNDGQLAADICLYDIPKVDGMTDEVKEIIRLQGLVHEYAHSIAIGLSYIDGYSLRIGDTTMSGIDVLETFANLTGNTTPISHYSSAYRTETGGYPDSDKNFEAWRVAVEEEFVEAITAYLLGFVFCEDPKRRMAPFNRDNAFVRDFIRLFLEARRI